RRSARQRRGGTRTRVRRPVDNGSVPRRQRGRGRSEGSGLFSRLDRFGPHTGTHDFRQEEPLRLLARSALAATAGVAAGLAFEPYHWWFLLPIAVAALTLLAVAAP